MTRSAFNQVYYNFLPCSDANSLADIVPNAWARVPMPTDDELR